MASAIEAHSLASLNTLAANPPQYPINPAEQKQEPLTLYISRVPGTRDVILSTSKPQLKNVTAHDVANSLYYIHLEVPSDAVPPPPGPNRSHESPRSSSSFDGAQPENRIKRKPVPGGAGAQVHPSTSPARAPGGHPVRDSQGLPPPPPYEEQSRHHPLPPLPPAHQELPPTPPPHNQQASLPDRPAPDVRRWTGDGRTWYSVEDTPDLPGSRSSSRSPAMRDQPRLSAQPALNTPRSPARDSYQAPMPPQRRDFDLPSPPMPPRPISSERSPSPGYARQTRSERQPQERARSRSPSPIKYHNTTAVPYILHLIRRDANTGHQWNIGRITSSQLEHSLDEDYAYASFDSAGLATSEARRKATAPQPEISVTLETSGYAKFRGMPSRRSVDDAARRALGNDPRSSQSSLARPGSATGGDASSIRQGESGFNRRVRMTYTKSFTSNLREKFASTSLKPEDARSPPLPQHGGRHSRQPSNLSATSADSAASLSDDAIITQPAYGLRPKGYMFLSPWDGACHFRTGNGGRSLKLRHTLPSPAPGQPAPSVQASELRFNLPGRELFYKGKDEAMARKAELTGQFGKFMRGEHRSGHDDWDDDDMQLGKEKAGGGNRGKRAKLGKLIVHPEGMKMLDLVVAANMGVWWGAWERSF